jgi:hypothetical protein
MPAMHGVLLRVQSVVFARVPNFTRYGRVLQRMLRPAESARQKNPRTRHATYRAMQPRQKSPAKKSSVANFFGEGP